MQAYVSLEAFEMLISTRMEMISWMDKIPTMMCGGK